MYSPQGSEVIPQIYSQKEERMRRGNEIKI